MGGGKAWPSIETTRLRHAEGRLLMLQNPHRQPEIHPGAVGGGSESTGALRDTGLATAPAGGDPTTSRQISHVISPRSLFKITRKRCNSNDVDSTFELIAWELRATLMGGGKAWPSIETTRRRHAEGRLLMMQNPHHYPWCHAPSRVEYSRSGGIFTMGRILSEAGGASILARQHRPRRYLGLSHDQHVLSYSPVDAARAPRRRGARAGRLVLLVLRGQTRLSVDILNLVPQPLVIVEVTEPFPLCLQGQLVVFLAFENLLDPSNLL